MNIENGTTIQKVVYMRAPGDRVIAEERFAEYATAWGLRLNSVEEEPRSVYGVKGELIGRQVRYCAHLTVVEINGE